MSACPQPFLPYFPPFRLSRPVGCGHAVRGGGLLRHQGSGGHHPRVCPLPRPLLRSAGARPGGPPLQFGLEEFCCSACMAAAVAAAGLLKALASMASIGRAGKGLPGSDQLFTSRYVGTTLPPRPPTPHPAQPTPSHPIPCGDTHAIIVTPTPLTPHLTFPLAPGLPTRARSTHPFAPPKSPTLGAPHRFKPLLRPALQ